MASRQYVIGGPTGGFVVNEVQTQQFDAFGAYVDSTANKVYTLAVAQTTLSFSAQAVTVRVFRNLAVAPMTLTFAPQSVTLTITIGATFTVSGGKVEGQFPHNGISLVDDVSFPYHTQQRTN